MTDVSDEDLNRLIDRWESFREQGEEPSLDDIFDADPVSRQRPELREQFRQLVAKLQLFDSEFGTTQPSSKSPAPELGKFCHDRYLVEQFFEQGGLGTLYLARDTELDRVVVVKGMRPDRSGDGDSRKSFINEAAITGQLEHPGIVSVYGFGFDEQKRPYYAMRMIRGTTLGDAIEKFHAAGHASDLHNVEFQRLLREFLSVCQTIAYAHSRGIIHRDIKPANIMLGKFGEVLVVDWGLAKHVAEQDSPGEADSVPLSVPETNLTTAGTVKGSPRYMSPEQADGRIGDIGAASDLYSLGATLYELITGRSPYAGKSIGEILDDVRQANVIPPRTVRPQLSAALEAVCLKAMSRRPEDRYSTVLELARDLERWLADEPISVYREPWRHRLRRWSRQHRTLVSGVMAGLGVALVTVSVAAILLAIQDSQLKIANRVLQEQQLELRKNDATSQFLVAKTSFTGGDLQQAEMFLNLIDEDLRSVEWFELKQIVTPPITCYEQQDIAMQQGSGLLKFNIPTGMTTPPAVDVDLAPDGQSLAVLQPEVIGGLALAQRTWSVRIEELQSGTLVGRIAGEGEPQAVRFSRDGQRLAVVVKPVPKVEASPMVTAIERELEKRNEARGKSLQKFLNKPRTTFDPAATPAEPDPPPTIDFTEIRVWNVADQHFIETIERERFSAEFERPSEGTANTSDGGQFFIETDEGLNRTPLPLGTSIANFAVHPETERIATIGDDRLIRFWRMGSGELVGKIAARGSSAKFLRFVSNGKQIAWLGGDGAVRIADVPAGPALQTLPTALSDDSLVKAVLSRDARQIASLHRDGSVRLWNAETLAEIHTFTRPKLPPDIAAAVDKRRVDLAFSDDGQVLAVTGNNDLAVFDVVSGQQRFAFSQAAGPVRFSRDGSRLISLRLEERTGPTVIDAVTGREIDFVSTSSVSIPNVDFALHPEGDIVIRRETAGAQIFVWRGRPARTAAARHEALARRQRCRTI